MESEEIKNGKNLSGSKFNQEIHSKIIRAGKRTYFFDVKSTRNDEYYLTITESKKNYGENGKFNYEKHKIFLYKEDFSRFVEGLQDVVSYIREKQPENMESEDFIDEDNSENELIAEAATKNYTDIEFEDI
jgi:hypothetical protein